MKTLLLQDEIFERLLEVLGATDEGKDLIRAFGTRPRLPSDRELVAMARGRSDPPEAIARARAYRDAGRQAATDTREEMERLLLHCFKAGVGPAVLARWFGLKPARVYEILAKRKTEERSPL